MILINTFYFKELIQEKTRTLDVTMDNQIKIEEKNCTSIFIIMK
ncbi:hypothetical protein ACSXAB_01305 [Clostridium perfringens]|nr:hypothetical protein [Clostridium perfringens]MDK0538120.1 hypothetical protein [Clostridium perfringens]MDU6634203.1 hypothetical protein [Clostridium perfringens]